MITKLKWQAGNLNTVKKKHAADIKYNGITTALAKLLQEEIIHANVLNYIYKIVIIHIFNVIMNEY